MTYWITELNTGSVKSPYAIRLTLGTEPPNMPEIAEWLATTFGKFGYYFKHVGYPAYAEIYMKRESDVTSFILKWGDMLNVPADD